MTKKLIRGVFLKDNPPTGGSSVSRKTKLPIDKTYVSHNNIQQKIRNLKKACLPIKKLKDEFSLYALNRVTENTNNEYTRLMLMYTALEISNNTEDVSWAEAMNSVLDKIEDDILKEIKEDEDEKNESS